MDGSEISNLDIGTVAGKVRTKSGFVIVLMHQYAIYGKGKTIYAEPQLLNFGINVDSKSRKLKYNPDANALLLSKGG